MVAIIWIHSLSLKHRKTTLDSDSSTPSQLVCLLLSLPSYYPTQLLYSLNQKKPNQRRIEFSFKPKKQREMSGYVGILVSDPLLQNQFTQVELRSLKTHVRKWVFFFFLFYNLNLYIFVKNIKKCPVELRVSWGFFFFFFFMNLYVFVFCVWWWCSLWAWGERVGEWHWESWRRRCLVWKWLERISLKKRELRLSMISILIIMTTTMSTLSFFLESVSCQTPNFVDWIWVFKLAFFTFF